MSYYGDFIEDATVRIYFTTNDGSGGAVAPSTAFEAADAVIYKNGSATQKATTNGITMTSPFDSVTGLHLLEIDTSVDTGDTGFWATGNDYAVILKPDETVDSQTVVAPLAVFSIENRTQSILSIDGKTLKQAMRYMAAVLAGKVSGAAPNGGTETFVGLDGSTNRVASTVDKNGNRSAVSYD